MKPIELSSPLIADEATPAGPPSWIARLFGGLRSFWRAYRQAVRDGSDSSVDETIV